MRDKLPKIFIILNEVIKIITELPVTLLQNIFQYNSLSFFSDQEVNDLLKIYIGQVEVIKDFGCESSNQEMSRLLKNIGVCYERLENIVESQKYYEKAKEYKIIRDDEGNEVSITNDIIPLELLGE